MEVWNSVSVCTLISHALMSPFCNCNENSFSNLAEEVGLLIDLLIKKPVSSGSSWQTVFCG